MKKILIKCLPLIFLSTLTVGCETTRSDVGLVGGGVVGGLVGAAVTPHSAVGPVVGAVGGAVIGSQLTRGPRYGGYYYY